MSEPAVKQVVLASRPKGPPTAENFRLETVPMPALPTGGLLLRVLYLSLDPYMRGRMDDAKSYAKPVGVGEVMTGESVCEVVASDRPGYAAGDIVLAHTGWRTHAPWSGPALRKLDPKQAPITTGLRRARHARLHRVFGPIVIGKPKAAETVVDSAASGPVGSLVVSTREDGRGAGSWYCRRREKCRYVVEELRFDAAIDHKAAVFPAQLAVACPKGIDVYFENVGGAVWQAVLPLLNTYARVPVCGLIAHYSAAGQPWTQPAAPDHARCTDPKPDPARLHQHRICRRALPGFPETGLGGARRRPHPLPRRHRDGLENAPAAFIGLLQGKNSARRWCGSRTNQSKQTTTRRAATYWKHLINAENGPRLSAAMMSSWRPRRPGGRGAAGVTPPAASASA